MSGSLPTYRFLMSAVVLFVTDLSVLVLKETLKLLQNTGIKKYGFLGLIPKKGTKTGRDIFISLSDITVNFILNRFEQSMYL